MPSSFGHALAGYAVARLLGGRSAPDWPCIAAAIAPDVDILVRLNRSGPVDYSNRRSHSVGAAVAAGVAVGALDRIRGGRFLRGAASGSAAYASHLVLDYFGKESEDGLPLLWPLSKRHFAAPHPVFGTIYSRRDHFVGGLFTLRNLKKVAREIAIIVPAILVAGVVAMPFRTR